MEIRISPIGHFDPERFLKASRGTYYPLWGTEPMTELNGEEIEDVLEQITKSDRWKEIGPHAAFMFFPNSGTSGLSIIDGGQIHQQVDADILNMRPCDIPRALFKIAKMVRPPRPKKRGWRRGDQVRAAAGPARYLVISTSTGDEGPYFKAVEIGAGLVIGGYQHKFHNLTIEAEMAGK